MKQIQLAPHKTLGIKFATCDDADHPTLMKHRWYLHRYGWAVTTLPGGIKQTMHRMLMEKEHGSIGVRVSTVDGNFLNVCRSNLQVKTTIMKKLSATARLMKEFKNVRSR